MLLVWPTGQLINRSTNVTSLRQEAPRGFEILGGIDGDGVIIGDDGLESEAVGEEAELLEGFDGFEFGRLELGVAGERGAVVTIDADVHPVIAARDPFSRIDTAEVRDRAARK